MMIHKMVYVEPTVLIQRRMESNKWWYKFLSENRYKMRSPDNCVNMNDSEVAISVLEGWFYHPHPRQFVRLLSNIIKPMYQCTGIR